MKKRVVFILALCVALPVFAVISSFGKPVFMKEVPNGEKNKCPTCHLAGQMPSKATLNAFGKDFRNAGFKWTAELAKKDSDGDGVSNGRELGDPFGSWKKGDADPAGSIFNPGDPAIK